MTKYTRIHPLITKIDRLSDDSYLVYEKFLFTPMLFTYPVTVKGIRTNNTVEMQAKIMNWIGINIHFTILPGITDHLVHEEIIVHAPGAIRYMIEFIFRKQHALLFENLEKLHG
jgi:hypothetical protein